VTPASNGFECPRCGRTIHRTAREKPRKIRCPRCRYLIFDYPRPCAGMVVMKGDEVLTLRRGHPPRLGCLDLPGGFLEAGEEIEGAARRELLEETGLRVGRSDWLGLYWDRYYLRGFGWFPTMNFYYLARWRSGEPRASDDAASTEWVPLRRLGAGDARYAWRHMSEVFRDVRARWRKTARAVALAACLGLLTSNAACASPASRTAERAPAKVEDRAAAKPAVQAASSARPPATRGTPARAAGIWISRDEIRALPMSGPAWAALVAHADLPAARPNLSDQDQANNVHVLAKALVFARTGQERYRTEVRSNCIGAIDTERGGRTLALGRELAAYVIAADLVGLEPAEDARFRAWLRRALTVELENKTLRSTHEVRPNNWGTMAGASRAAVAAYLGDKAELARTAQVFKGWLGDRSAYAGFKYGDLSWQSDPLHPVGINPKDATKNGESISGALPDDMRRGCAFQMPPCRTNYPWGALQGALVQAEILHRQGYDAWNWQDQALLRAVSYLAELDRRYDDWWAGGDDQWSIWLVNRAYGTHFPAVSPARPGKIMAWTDWTHAPRADAPRGAGSSAPARGR
jgi:ADP-ribose pyrophosphatase YjhB (NUDIX family)